MKRYPVKQFVAILAIVVAISGILFGVPPVRQRITDRIDNVREISHLKNTAKCVNNSDEPAITIVGYKQGTELGRVAFTVFFLIPDTGPIGDAKFEEINTILFKCITKYKWKEVVLVFLDAELVQTLDDMDHHVMATPLGILDVSGVALDTMDFSIPVLEQLYIYVSNGTAIYIPYWMGGDFMLNIDGKLAAQRYVEAVESVK